MTPNLPKQPPEAIAEDVMRAAIIAVGEIDADFTFDGQWSGRREIEEAREIVARAITAERERCDAICDRFLTGLPSRDTSSTARGIQQFIRAGA